VGDQPDRESDDAGIADATIRAFRRGNDTITVVLVDDLNNFVSEASVQKRVTEGQAQARAASRVTIRDRFRGRVTSSRRSCRVNRRVIVKKVRPGRDRTVGSDRTNNRGRWRLRRPNANGRFYAQVNRNAACRGDRSRTIRK
jgi:hypothetical protein